MTARELLEIIANGENSAVEFKRETVRPEHLAEEIVSFAYMENLRYVDRLGRGIPMIIRQMKNAAGKEPGLEEKGTD